MDNCLTILSESLDKKIEVLKKIQEYNLVQEKTFLSGEPDMESFDEAIEEKDKLIEELMKLDEGFETLYGEIRQELGANRTRYADKLKELQDKIRTVTELANAVEAKESRNKKLIEDFFSKKRVEIKQGRQKSKAAYDYYKSMSGNGSNASNLWDSKQ